MAEVSHVFICDRAYKDDRGQPCVIGMFDHIWAPQFPLSHPHIVIAIQMLGHQHETYDLTVDVVNPTNKVVLSASWMHRTPCPVSAKVSSLWLSLIHRLRRRDAIPSGFRLRVGL